MLLHLYAVVGVRHDMTLKLVCNEKLSAKGRDIPIFNLYLCHVIKLLLALNYGIKSGEILT